MELLNHGYLVTTRALYSNDGLRSNTQYVQDIPDMTVFAHILLVHSIVLVQLLGPSGQASHDFFNTNAITPKSNTGQ
jgi:hypothetical protein